MDITETLQFHPDEIQLTGDDATQVEGVIPDRDYLVLGYWLEATAARDDEETCQLSLIQ
ncbi:MAG: hypothetical protein OXI37_04455 [Gammaproteobacteria bacterium]|nr:hypothetical protein [Gammaproteobacteria bacterium]